MRILTKLFKKKVREAVQIGQEREYRVKRCDVPAGKPVFSPVWRGREAEGSVAAREKGWEKLLRIVKLAQSRESGDKPFYSDILSEKVRGEICMPRVNTDRCGSAESGKNVRAERREMPRTDRRRDAGVGTSMHAEEEMNVFSDDFFCGLASLRGLNVEERGFKGRG